MAASLIKGSSLSSSDGREDWRNIVLYGRNVASYKFALAKALLELAGADQELIRLEDLAVPFARHICEHIRNVDRQGSFERSRFLDACRFFNADVITADELRDTAILIGFNNVIDAFHTVGGGSVETRFFVDERRTAGGIWLTQALIDLGLDPMVGDLLGETEARWRLVESAWEARAANRPVAVRYDAPRELLVPALQGKRRSITEVRPALNGYQQGHCFYCFRPISFTSLDPAEAIDVDHFFPHALMARGLGVDVDMPWNLVLACSRCNRGPGGKFAALPHNRYLDRLRRRNEYLIASQHPLRESLVSVMGKTPESRHQFLREVEVGARALVPTVGWSAREEQRPLF